jgi:hypothetical protein
VFFAACHGCNKRPIMMNRFLRNAFLILCGVATALRLEAT